MKTIARRPWMHFFALVSNWNLICWNRSSFKLSQYRQRKSLNVYRGKLGAQKWKLKTSELSDPKCSNSAKTRSFIRRRFRIYRTDFDAIVIKNIRDILGHRFGPTAIRDLVALLPPARIEFLLGPIQGGNRPIGLRFSNTLILNMIIIYKSPIRGKFFSRIYTVECSAFFKYFFF